MKKREGLLKLKQFNVEEKSRRVEQIETMLSEFEQMAAELHNQITEEQNRVGIDDVTHFAYPTVARAAAQRRDNILNSAKDLQEQLVKAKGELDDATEELRKVELMDEREQLRERDPNTDHDLTIGEPEKSRIASR
ncbi:flagellar export protein FliJ [Flexibacterium corallicola]|uniref:flagellar export protein FliJ n=1 Tax=Flexibacterium corallicola TaxID=3037259 RepID=UPI00286F6272|nr:flagellar export protein FliJ [Pseudovibrio sp. M1P-2-3]